MKWIAIIMSVTFLSTGGALAAQIVLVADEWCPYNCLEGSRKPGFVAEIAGHIFKKKGHTVVYKNVPWARAIRGTRTGKYDGIIGTGKQETPDFVFPDIEQGRAVHCFYVREGNPWRYRGLESLEEIRLGVIKQYSYGSLYKDYIRPNKDKPELIDVVTGDEGLRQNIRKLLHNRIDALVEDRNVFDHYLERHDIPESLFSMAGVACRENIYIAFSPVLPEAEKYADILSSGMKAMRASGELSGILEKYGIKDRQ